MSHINNQAHTPTLSLFPHAPSVWLFNC